MLNRDSRLYLHHVDSSRRFDFSRAVAAMGQNPRNLSIWGLNNMGESTWVATLPDATTRQIEPGRSIALARGLKIDFGKTEGEIRV
jgi:hypothetical protein